MAFNLDFLICGFNIFMSLCCRIFIDIDCISCIMTLAYDISFVVGTHKPTLSILLRILQAFLDFSLILNFDCEVYLTSVWYIFALPSCKLIFTLRFHFLSVWVHFHSLLSCNDTFYVSIFLFMITNNDPTSLLFKSNLYSTSVCFVRPFVMWHWFMIGLLLVLLTMRPFFWCIDTHMLAFIYLGITLITLLSHIPILQMYPHSYDV